MNSFVIVKNFDGNFVVSEKDAYDNFARCCYAEVPVCHIYQDLNKAKIDRDKLQKTSKKSKFSVVVLNTKKAY